MKEKILERIRTQVKAFDNHPSENFSVQNMIQCFNNIYDFVNDLKFTENKEKLPIKFSDSEKANIINLISDDSGWNDFYKIEVIKKVCEL